MRWPVAVVLDLMRSEVSLAERLEDHLELKRKDLRASLADAKLLVSGQNRKLMAIAC